MYSLKTFMLLSVCLISLTTGAPSNLLAVICERSPSLSMCSDASTFRAFDSSVDDSERFAKSISKHDIEEYQIVTYCDRHEEHYTVFCTGEGGFEKGLKTKILKFCPSFERFCPELASKLNRATVKRDSGVPLVEPPPLPSASQMGNEFGFKDLPIDEERPKQIPERQPDKALSAELIKTCTPDCTAPHCTRECKCANTHPSVHAKCNPPASAALAGVCQAWYNKCPMFKPVSF